MKHTSAHVQDDGVQVEKKIFLIKNRSIVWDYFGMYSSSPEYAEHATVKLKKIGVASPPIRRRMLSIKCFHWSLSRCGTGSLETCTHNSVAKM